MNSESDLLRITEFYNLTRVFRGFPDSLSIGNGGRSQQECEDKFILNFTKTK